MVSTRRSNTRRLQFRHDAEVIAGPHAVQWLVEDTDTSLDVQGGTPVVTAPNQNVVDAPKRPVRVGHERIDGREGMASILRVAAVPSIPVTHAHSAQRLATGPEAQARCVGWSIEVAGDDDMALGFGEVLEELRGRDGLPFALELKAQLPAGEVVDEQQRSDGTGGEDFGNQCASGPVGRTGRYVVVDAMDCPEWPAAGDRDALPLWLAFWVVRYVVLVAQEIDHLVISRCDNAFLERHQVGAQFAQTTDERAPPSTPTAVATPEIQCEDARPHTARTGVEGGSCGERPNVGRCRSTHALWAGVPSGSSTLRRRRCRRSHATARGTRLGRVGGCWLWRDSGARGSGCRARRSARPRSAGPSVLTTRQDRPPCWPTQQSRGRLSSPQRSVGRGRACVGRHAPISVVVAVSVIGSLLWLGTSSDGREPYDSPEVEPRSGNEIDTAGRYLTTTPDHAGGRLVVRRARPRRPDVAGFCPALGYRRPLDSRGLGRSGSGSP